MTARIMLWTAGALALVACHRAPRFELDRERLAFEVERRAGAVVARPEVTRGFDALAEAALHEPALAEAGARLLSALGNDPQLKPGGSAVLARLVASPQMRALGERLVREHPGADPARSAGSPASTSAASPVAPSSIAPSTTPSLPCLHAPTSSRRFTVWPRPSAAAPS